jgi:hypothetical protein
VNSSLEDAARPRSALERINPDADNRLWWRISADTPNRPIVRTGREVLGGQPGAHVRVVAADRRASVDLRGPPQLQRAGRKRRPRRPRLRGPGLT